MPALRLGSLMRREGICITTQLLQLIRFMHYDRPGESQEAMDGKKNHPRYLPQSFAEKRSFACGSYQTSRQLSAPFGSPFYHFEAFVF